MLTTDNQLGDPGAGLFLTSEKAVFCNFKFRFCIQNGREIALTMEGLHCSLIPSWVNVPEQPPCQLQLLQLQHLPCLLLQREGNLPLGNESEARLPEGGQPGGQPGWFSSTDPSTSPSTIASTNPSNTFFASSLWDPVGGITDGEVNRNQIRIMHPPLKASQYFSILFIQKPASIATTDFSILDQQYCNAYKKMHCQTQGMMMVALNGSW